MQLSYGKKIVHICMFLIKKFKFCLEKRFDGMLRVVLEGGAREGAGARL
jgi:hypothetical protein